MKMLFLKNLGILRNGDKRKERYVRRRKCAILRNEISREMERNRRRISLDLEVWKQIQYYNHYYRL